MKNAIVKTMFSCVHVYLFNNSNKEEQYQRKEHRRVIGMQSGWKEVWKSSSYLVGSAHCFTSAGHLFAD